MEKYKCGECGKTVSVEETHRFDDCKEYKFEIKIIKQTTDKILDDFRSELQDRAHSDQIVEAADVFESLAKKHNYIL